MSNWKVSRGRCGTIPNQASIEERPAIVDTRLRFGDWEAILEIGAGRQQTLVTPNERKSRYTLIGKMQRKTAQAVSDIIASFLASYSHCALTLTTDNGKEFSQHERIADSIDADFFFAHTYARGSAAPTKT
jgi:IS30 family transposase